jgi:hypothetical protein
MTLLLLTGRTGLNSVGAAKRPAARGRPEWLPGLAAAAKKQRASHDQSRLADCGAARDANPRFGIFGFRDAEYGWLRPAMRP